MDEFSFLAGQAAALGVPLLPVRRVSHILGDGRILSALQFGDAATGTFPSPEVTFVHGAGLNAHTWDTTVLSLGRPALSIDLAGHGDSSWREDADYSATTLAPDVAEFLRAQGATAQVLVGQSLGGLTGAAVAASDASLVRALVVVDLTPGIDPNGGAAQIAAFFAGPEDFASREELVERALSFGLGGSPESAARGVFLNSRVREDGRVVWKHHFAHLASRPARDPAAAAAAAAHSATPREGVVSAGWANLSTATAPITLVRGSTGFVTSEDAAEFSRRLPAATVRELPGGHNLQEERPVELAEIISEAADSRVPL